VTGSPILPGSHAWLDCRLVSQHQEGDHTIFIGEVVGISDSGRADPLIFYRARYHSLT
jgi:flavin reductase (DIM6/NTAB) family NADH-FMN oxidoreductase RutF